jgi:hypothetical protein
MCRFYHCMYINYVEVKFKVSLSDYKVNTADLFGHDRCCDILKIDHN